MTASLLQLPTRSDHRGSLGVIEAGSDCPFPIKRIFYLFGAPETATRGQHAHRVLEQLIVVVSGSVVIAIDDGDSIARFVLDSPSVGLYVPPLHWTHLSQFSSAAVVIVLASEHFDLEDYIHDQAEFRELTSAR
jgi:UDP-2-acetamido-3-amino-2,3-dideoxy-glucuronate N-acetyltransferase